jgi:(p)ppGpp synthase/HD superfamily hydrolase
MRHAPTWVDTVKLMEDLHEGQTDLAGERYSLHPIMVVLGLPYWASTEARYAALLHDVVEDTPETLEKLRARGYSERVVQLVEMVTRTPEKGTYKEWIDSIASSGDADAIAIKLSDMRHNSSLERREGITDPEQRRKVEEMAQKRWLPGIAKLEAALTAMGKSIR